VVGQILGGGSFADETSMTEDNWALSVLLNVLAYVLIFAFGSVLAATTYVALRADKEGIGGVDLAKVFE
jgi:hypothetical protein